jgi:hypothetical protein
VERKKPLVMLHGRQSSCLMTGVLRALSVRSGLAVLVFYPVVLDGIEKPLPLIIQTLLKKFLSILTECIKIVKFG